MFGKKIILMATVFVFSACDVQAAVIHSTWVGGESGSWGNANNWDPAIVPNNTGLQTFSVTIDAGGDCVYVVVDMDCTIDSLSVSGADFFAGIKIPHGRFRIAVPNVTNYNGLEIHAIEIFGNVTNTAGAELELSGVDIYGNVFNPADGEIVVYCTSEINQGIQNEGLITFDTISELAVEPNLQNIGRIKIYGGECEAEEILHNNETGVIQGFGVIYVGELLWNEGQIVASGGSLAIMCDGPLTNTGTLGNNPPSSLHIKSAEDVNNQGTIEVNADGVAFDCNLVNEPNGTIKLLGGNLAATTITQKADSNFAGFGGITGDVLIEPDGIIKLTGPTNIIGNVTIDPNATLEISDGTTLITGHTTCNNGTIHMIGGRVICQGGLTNNNCNIMWEPGTYTNMADFNLDGTVNFKDFSYFGDTWLWQADWY